MKRLRVAVAVLNQTPLDWKGNVARCREVLGEARRQRVSLLCLPELCLSGYGCEDAFLSANTHARAWAALRDLLPETTGLVVAFGLPVRHQHAIYNVAAVAADGKLRGLVAKRFLAGDGLHYEPRWFKAWPLGVRAVFRAPDTGELLPIGDVFFDAGGVRIGFEICEDAWAANRPGVALAQAGVDIILNPSASHFAFGKCDIRRRFVIEGSRAYGVCYLYANLLGNEAGRALYDGDALIASGGRLLAEGPRFSFRDWVLTSAVVDVEATRLTQARVASFTPQVATSEALAVPFDFAWPTFDGEENVPPTARPASRPAWEGETDRKEEEFARAEALGLFDYLRKTYSRGFVVSLSGGADSSAIASLIYLMVRLGLDELGPEAWLKKLAYFPELAAALSTAEPHTAAQAAALMKELLMTAYQATENSGEVTRAAARAVAEAVGARHVELDVSALHRGYVQMIEGALGRPLEWNRDDLALQNIQARVRSPGIWLLANVRGALLLATSNRSEAAVGYATMDGDTSGGLSPLAGIDKAWLREWLRWLETTGPRLADGLRVSLPALHAVNVQAPTAELRPPSAVQTDEADLMPYPVLDVIERYAIRDQRSPLEVWQLVQPVFPHYSPVQLAEWVARFFRLWSRNQWKRERFAPSFHLDELNLDPRSWCRWPILSGGFATELEELRQAVAPK